MYILTGVCPPPVTDIHRECGHLREPVPVAAHLLAGESGRLQEQELLRAEPSHVSMAFARRFPFAPRVVADRCVQLFPPRPGKMLFSLFF